MAGNPIKPAEETTYAPRDRFSGMPDRPLSKAIVIPVITISKVHKAHWSITTRAIGGPIPLVSSQVAPEHNNDIVRGRVTVTAEQLGLRGRLAQRATRLKLHASPSVLGRRR